MLYPAYILTGDEEHAHGILFPDFPGCFAAADDWEHIPKAAQEALECHMAGEEQPIPQPTPLEPLTRQPDYQDDGIWMLIDIDASRLDGPP